MNAAYLVSKTISKHARMNVPGTKQKESDDNAWP